MLLKKTSRRPLENWPGSTTPTCMPSQIRKSRRRRSLRKPEKPTKYSAIQNAEKNMTCSDMQPPDRVEELTDSGLEAGASEICSEISLKTFSVGAEDEVEPNKAMTFNII